MVEQVEACEVARLGGTRGIGECVSAFASQHGKKVRSAHLTGASAENTRLHTPGPRAERAGGKPPGGGRLSSHPGKS